MSIYSLGTSLGMLFGLVMGGFVAEYYGWRWAFVCAGVPGLALALLLRITVREPIRGAMEEMTAAQRTQATGESMVAALRALWANRSYRYVNLAHMFGVFVGYGFTVWKPPLYLRQFDLSQSEVGLVVGITSAGLGVPGMLLGGYFADRLAKRDARGPAWLCAAAVLLATPAYLLALWSSNWVVTTIFIGLGLFLYSLSHAPGLAIVQSAVEPHRRAQAAAYVFFLSNILGLGLGPVLVGSISDSFAAHFDNRSLNVALGFVTLVLLAAAAMYWRTAKALQKSD